MAEHSRFVSFAIQYHSTANIWIHTHIYIYYIYDVFNGIYNIQSHNIGVSENEIYPPIYGNFSGKIRFSHIDFGVLPCVFQTNSELISCIMLYNVNVSNTYHFHGIYMGKNMMGPSYNFPILLGCLMGVVWK
jgi:hypothetical protein